MPFLGSLLGGLIQIAGTLAGRVLIALGIGVVSYSGIQVGLSYAENLIWTNMGALPSAVLQLVGYMRLDDAISLIISAVMARLTINGLTGGALKRWVTT